MTEEPIKVNETDVKPDYQTSFILALDWDNAWRAITDMTSAFVIDHEAGPGDIAFGTAQMSEFMKNDMLSSMIARKLSGENAPEGQQTAEAMRQALANRNLL